MDDKQLQPRAAAFGRRVTIHGAGGAAFEALQLAAAGRTTTSIMNATSLTAGQVAYRIRKYSVTGVRAATRNGSNEFSKVMYAAAGKMLAMITDGGSVEGTVKARKEFADAFREGMAMIPILKAPNSFAPSPNVG